MLDEPPAEKGGGDIQPMFGATPHCHSMAFSFSTTSCKRCGPLLPLRREPPGFGVPTGRTADDKQPPDLKGVQTRTAVALVPWQETHEVLMTARDQAAGALVVRREPWQETFVRA